MTKTKPNPSNIAEVITFLESIEAPEELMECSAIIYASECSTKKKVFENFIRYNDIALEDLVEQKNILENIIETAICNNLPVSDSTQKYIIDMKNLIDTKIMSSDNLERDINSCKLNFLNNYQGKDGDIYKLRMDNIRPHNNIKSQIHNIFSKDIINAAGVIFIMHELVDSDLPDDAKKELFLKLGSSISNTIEYQEKNNFKDVPMRQCLPLIKNELKCIYKDKSNVCEKVDLYMDELIEDAGFDPNPYNVYTLTPFDCGVRTMGSIIFDIASSKTDEEVEEAMVLFSRLETACEKCSEEILNEGEVSRVVTRTINKGANKISNWKSPIKKGKEAVGRALDPLSKLVTNWLGEIEDADKKERQDIIIKGGVIPKIGRMVRRALETTAGFIIAGPVLAAIVFFGRLATDKYMDYKVKKQIMQELEEELNIVNEKIDDSRGDENKQKKYELMRIRNKLESELKRIKLNMKY